MPLLERAEELAALDRALAAADAGSGRVVLVTGEAGLGKSTLLQAWLARPPARDRTVLRGWCEPGPTRALAPLDDLAAGLTLPPSPASGTDTATGRSRAELFRGVLAGVPAGAVLVVEDLHWADDATVDLVGFLGRRLASVPALLVLAYRDEEAGPRDPVRSCVGDLATSPGVLRLPLAPLSLAAVRELAGEGAEDLHRLTDGNPFFVTEVLASPGTPLPATIRDAVLARAARLSSSARAVLDVCAVVGARVEPWLLESVLAAEAGAVEECLTAGIVVADEDVLTFRHELARQAVLSALPPTRRRTLHGYVLAALGTSDRPHDPARSATHAVGADDGPAVLRHAPEAGRQASRAQAHRQAHEHYRSALAYAVGVPAEGRAALQEALADACAALDLIDEGLAALAEALVVRRAAGDADRVCDDLLASVPLLSYAGRTEEAERASREAVEVARTLPPGRRLARALRQQAHLRMLARDVDEAVRWGEQAIALAEEHDEPSTASAAHNTVGSALLSRDVEAGVARLERARDLAREHGYDQLEAHALLNLGSGLGELRHPRRAAAYLDAALAHPRSEDLRSTTSYAEAWRALVHLDAGEWDACARVAARVLGRPDVSAIARVMALLALGRLRARRGDPGATDALDEALALAEASGILQRVAPVRAARIEAALLAGRDPGAEVAPARAAYDAALARRQPVFVGELGLWLSRAGVSVALPSWADPGFALLLAGDAVGSARVWHERGCVYEEALALGLGDDRSRIEALGLLGRLGAGPLRDAVRRDLVRRHVKGVPRAPRATPRPDPWGLTAREQEVLALVADGVSNEQAAQRLTLSRRTVEHHVSAALAKMGVATRGEAGAAWRANLGVLTDVGSAAAP